MIDLGLGVGLEGTPGRFPFVVRPAGCEFCRYREYNPQPAGCKAHRLPTTITPLSSVEATQIKARPLGPA